MPLDGATDPSPPVAVSSGQSQLLEFTVQISWLANSSSCPFCLLVYPQWNDDISICLIDDDDDDDGLSYVVGENQRRWANTSSLVLCSFMFVFKCKC